MKSYGRLRENIFYKSMRDIKKEGILFFLRKSNRYFYHKFLKIYGKNIISNLNKKPIEYFTFQGKQFEYLLHPYNLCWINERTVEIPIILDYIKLKNPKNILEIGAVLTHYIEAKWEIVDMFEKGTGITNIDIVNFKPDKYYDMIVSISTLEHVGFDDENKPEKIILAINQMKKWLNKEGIIIATMPLGYNLYMDNLVFSKKLGFEKMYFLKRINRKNKWIEVPMNEVIGIKYNHPYNNANAIVIGVHENGNKIHN